MSVRQWASSCPRPDCTGRFAEERHVTVRVTSLPERSETSSSKWIVECEHGHQFLCTAAKDAGARTEYQVSVP